MSSSIRFDDLCPGDVFFSAAYRWETVVSRAPVPDASWLTRVCTDATGVAYGYCLPGYCTVVAVRAPQVRQTAVVRIEERPWRIDVRLGAADLPYGVGEVLAEAVRDRRARGWQFADRPEGAQLVTQAVPTKAKALKLIRRAALRHAHALDLTVAEASR